MPESGATGNQPAPLKLPLGQSRKASALFNVLDALEGQLDQWAERDTAIQRYGEANARAQRARELRQALEAERQQQADAAEARQRAADEARRQQEAEDDEFVTLLHLLHEGF